MSVFGNCVYCARGTCRCEWWRILFAMGLSMVTASRMSVYCEDGRKVLELVAKIDAKTVRSSDIKEFSNQVRLVSNTFAKLKDKRTSFVDAVALRKRVADGLEICKSKEREIKGDFERTTYRHNRRKSSEFERKQEKLSNIKSDFRGWIKNEEFNRSRTEKREVSAMINAKQNRERKEALKKDPNANYNGGMVR